MPVGFRVFAQMTTFLGKIVHEMKKNPNFALVLNTM